MRRAAIIEKFRHFWRDCNGATAIEYALMAAGISAAIILAVNALGVKVASMWSTVSAGLH